MKMLRAASRARREVAETVISGNAAPTLLSARLGRVTMAKIYNLRAGSKVPDDIAALAARDKIPTALLSAIGGVGRVTIAYFNQETRKYEEHEFVEELEVTSLLGNVTVKDGRPFVHVHGTFGRRDMSVVGGHVVSATVSPLLELVVTPTSNRALRRLDEELGLSVIYRS
jgi:predicted DNA-binding protein with PD1-like motif